MPRTVSSGTTGKPSRSRRPRTCWPASSQALLCNDADARRGGRSLDGRSASRPRARWCTLARKAGSTRAGRRPGAWRSSPSIPSTEVHGHADHDHARPRLAMLVKGAPERVLRAVRAPARRRRRTRAAGPRLLGGADRGAGAEGLRVLAAAAAGRRGRQAARPRARRSRERAGVPGPGRHPRPAAPGGGRGHRRLPRRPASASR